MTNNPELGTELKPMQTFIRSLYWIKPFTPSDEHEAAANSKGALAGIYTLSLVAPDW